MSLGRSFTALTGANAVSMGAQLVRGKLAALVLGPGGVGIFNQLSVMWNLFAVSGGLGSFLGVVQHGTEALSDRDEAALRRLSSTFLLLLGLLSCALALIGALFSPQLSNLLLHDGGRHSALVALILLAVPLSNGAQTYHALLSAARAVRQLVITQVVTDVGAMLVFAALIYPLGLTGAVAGFIATYAIMIVAKAMAVRRLLGGRLVTPRPSEFSWAVVRSNVGYGMSALLMTAFTNLAILIASRIIIDRLGVGANGIFANSWRIASVYLGSVTTTAFAYLMPTLGRSQNDRQMSDEINHALRFYLTVLPLPMTAVMIGGELLVWLVLSRQFLPVAGLLLLFVPAELLRIVSETLALTLLVRRKIAWYTGISALQFAVFLSGAALLVPVMGLKGAALAYFLGYTGGALANVVVTAVQFGIKLQPSLQRLMLFAALLLSGAASIAGNFPFGVMRVALGAALCLGWIGMMLIDPAARSNALGLIGQLKRSPAS